MSEIHAYFSFDMKRVERTRFCGLAHVVLLCERFARFPEVVIAFRRLCALQKSSLVQQEFLKEKMMKATQLLKSGVWIGLVCFLLVLVRLPLQAQASRTSPSVQMLQGTFPDQNLPEDGSTVTLVSIPFSVTAVAKLQGTSLMDAQFGGGNCCGQGGTVVTETCSLVLDGSIPLFTTTWSSNATLPASLSMTGTDSGVSVGSHALSVQCTGSTNTGSPGESVLARSGGTSLIVVSGA